MRAWSQPAPAPPSWPGAADWRAWSFSKASWTGSSDGSSVYAAGPSALSEMNVEDFAFDSLCGTLRSFDDLIVFARRRIDSAASISGGCWSHWNSSIFSSSSRTRAARPSAPSASSDEPSRSSAFASSAVASCSDSFAASGGLAESRRASSAYVTTARYPSDVATIDALRAPPEKRPPSPMIMPTPRSAPSGWPSSIGLRPPCSSTPKYCAGSPCTITVSPGANLRIASSFCRSSSCWKSKSLKYSLHACVSASSFTASSSLTSS